MSLAPLTHYIKANGIRIRCLEWGSARDAESARSRPEVLLLHGLTSCAETWSLVAPLLADGARVLAPDLRGHGETEKPEEGYDYESLGRDVLGVLDVLEVRQAAVAGHSWGAGVAWELATGQPQRVTHLALVEGGFFGGGGSGDPTPERLEQMLAPLSIYASRDTYLSAVREHFPGPWTTGLERIALASIYQNPNGSVREKLSREHQKLILRAMLAGRASERDRAISCPSLIIVAEDSSPAAQQRMARKRAAVDEAARGLPGCLVRWVAGSVHDVQLHRPEMVAVTLQEFFGLPAGKEKAS